MRWRFTLTNKSPLQEDISEPLQACFYWPLAVLCSLSFKVLEAQHCRLYIYNVSTVYYGVLNGNTIISTLMPPTPIMHITRTLPISVTPVCILIPIHFLSSFS